MRVQSLGCEDSLKEGMTTHSSSCLENPMDRGAWQARFIGSQSGTQLTWLSTKMWRVSTFRWELLAQKISGQDGIPGKDHQLGGKSATQKKRTRIKRKEVPRRNNEVNSLELEKHIWHFGESGGIYLIKRKEHPHKKDIREHERTCSE